MSTLRLTFVFLLTFAFRWTFAFWLTLVRALPRTAATVKVALHRRATSAIAADPRKLQVMMALHF